MSLANLSQYGFFLLTVAVLVKPVGGYLARVFEGERTFLDWLLRPLERWIYRLARVDLQHEMSWREYANSFILFSLAGTALLFLILRLQSFLPLFSRNAAYLTTPLTPDLAMNTAISFATTTTWQAYGGETTVSYFSQVVGLTVQNFLAGAAGLAVGIAFIRGLTRARKETLGNFWVDLVRGLLWVLLPLSVLGSLALVSQGVPVNFNAYTNAVTLEGSRQVIAQGPVAVLEFIKNLGTNGGGFFNVNGAHPYENPTPFSNFIEMLAIILLPASLTYTFGRMVGRTRHGWLLFWVMAVLFAAGLLLNDWAERKGNPLVARAINAPVIAADPSNSNEDDRYLGSVSNERLARRVFEQLDPSLFVDEHTRATTGLLHLSQSVAGLPAHSLIEAGSHRYVAGRPLPTRCARFIRRRGTRRRSLTTRGNCWASSGRPTFCASGSKTRSSRRCEMKPNHFIEMCPTSGRGENR